MLTPRCAHGPNGACPHCLPPSEEEFDKRREEPLNKAVAFNAKAAERSKVTAGAEAGEMEWLCRHRPDAMCLNCAPLRKGEKVELEMLCQHAPDARCINCLPPDSKVDGRKHISYGEMLEEAKSRCSHPFSATCVHCAGPSDRRYKLKPGCAKHAAWPRGICLEWCVSSHLLLAVVRRTTSLSARQPVAALCFTWLNSFLCLHCP